MYAWGRPACWRGEVAAGGQPGGQLQRPDGRAVWQVAPPCPPFAHARPSSPLFVSYARRYWITNGAVHAHVSSVGGRTVLSCNSGGWQPVDSRHAPAVAGAPPADGPGARPPARPPARQLPTLPSPSPSPRNSGRWCLRSSSSAPPGRASTGSWCPCARSRWVAWAARERSRAAAAARAAAARSPPAVPLPCRQQGPLRAAALPAAPTCKQPRQPGAFCKPPCPAAPCPAPPRPQNMRPFPGVGIDDMGHKMGEGRQGEGGGRRGGETVGRAHGGAGQRSRGSRLGAWTDASCWPGPCERAAGICRRCPHPVPALDCPPPPGQAATAWTTQSCRSTVSRPPGLVNRRGGHGFAGTRAATAPLHPTPAVLPRPLARCRRARAA